MGWQEERILAENQEKLRMWRQCKHILYSNCYQGNVTGLTHHHYDECKESIVKGTYLEVRRCPDNKYDPRATGLFFCGKQIGWIPKALNSYAAELLDEGAVLKARVDSHTAHPDIQHRLYVSVYTTQLPIKETITEPEDKEQDNMSNTQIQTIVAKNIKLGTSAAFLEAGRIANNQLSGMASKKLPLMARGYADTPLGRLLIANVASMAAEHFRPGDEKFKNLTNAMVVSAYQEVLQQFDVESFIDDILSNNTIKKALNKMGEVEEEVATATPKRGK